MIILQPEDRRGKESALPPKWTIFDANLHEPPQGVIASLDDLTGWTAEAHEITGAFGVSPACALWGEVGAFVGTGGARGMFGSAAVPLGSDGFAAFSFEHSDYGRRRR